MKITKKTLEKLIREELETSGFRPSSSMATLVAALPNSDDDAYMITTGRDPENTELIVTTLKGMVGNNPKKAEATMLQAMEKQAAAAQVDGSPVLSSNSQGDMIRAFFDNGRLSFFNPVPMQESKNKKISKKKLAQIIKEELEITVKERAGHKIA